MNSQRLSLPFSISTVLALVACGTHAPDHSAQEAPSEQAAPTESASSSTTPQDTATELAALGVVNFTQVDATVGCAGATPPEAMSQLAASGFRTVINFRTAEEGGAQIEASQAAAAEAGLRYVHLPFRTPSEEVAEAFLAETADTANQPVFIHCGSANRVGAMWLIKRVKQDGWEVERALEEAEDIGLSSEALRDFALGYVGAAD